VTTFDDHDLHTLAGAYVLDAITDEERSRFAAHLADCAGCRDEVDELREAASRLGTAHAVRPRPPLREQAIRAACNTGQLAPVIAENEHRSHAGGAARARRVPRRPVLLTAAAAAVVVAAVIGIGTHYADIQARQPPQGAHGGRRVQRTRRRDAYAPVSGGGMAIVMTSAGPHGRVHRAWAAGAPARGTNCG
jgi:anti-sigma factor RsiW